MNFDLSQYNFQAYFKQLKSVHIEQQFIVSFMDVIAKVNDCDDNFSFFVTSIYVQKGKQ